MQHNVMHTAWSSPKGTSALAPTPDMRMQPHAYEASARSVERSACARRIIATQAQTHIHVGVVHHSHNNTQLTNLQIHLDLNTAVGRPAGAEIQ
jgi:hypothetical protein